MRIKNWSKFQHFKDRNPPWIKLHRETLNRRDIMMISSCAFRLLVLLWIIASEDKEKMGNLPCVEDIAFQTRLPAEKVIDLLQELTPWIEEIDINTISPRYQNDIKMDPQRREETEAERETEAETRKNVVSDKPKRPAPKQTDEGWLLSLKENPAYKHINFDIEIGKAQAWSVNRAASVARGFLLNWFNKIEAPVNLSAGSRPKSFREQVNQSAVEAFVSGNF